MTPSGHRAYSRFVGPVTESVVIDNAGPQPCHFAMIILLDFQSSQPSTDASGGPRLRDGPGLCATVTGSAGAGIPSRRRPRRSRPGAGIRTGRGWRANTGAREWTVLVAVAAPMPRSRHRGALSGARCGAPQAGLVMGLKLLDSGHLEGVGARLTLQMNGCRVR
jgi:hypothetical protein